MLASWFNSRQLLIIVESSSRSKGKIKRSLGLSKALPTFDNLKQYGITIGE
jgi:hypothetical protein